MDATFTTPLIVEPVPHDDLRWRLVKPLIYRVNLRRSWCGPIEGQYKTHPARGYAITVPAGFTTDFASIPRIFWRIIIPSGSHREAAVIHDYLYAAGDRHKAVADAIFLEAMAVLRVPAWRRWTMFFAVLLFGGKAWRAHRKNDTVF